MAEAVLRINVSEALMKLQNAEERLREATREANEAIQGLKQAKKDIADTWAEVEGEIAKAIAERTAAGLKGFESATLESIKKSEAIIYKRFDDLCDILLGEDARAKGWPLREFAERIAQVHRDRAMRCLGVDSLEQYDPERGGPVSHDGASG